MRLVLKREQDIAKRGIRQQRLNLNDLNLFVFSDYSHANHPDLALQLGYIALIADGTEKANIVLFASYKPKRIVRSVLGGEKNAFLDGFAYLYLPRHELKLIIGKSVPLSIFTDSECLFKIIFKSTTTTKKRLRSEVNVAREAYEAREISDFG